jgi:hypothetical protein
VHVIDLKENLRAELIRHGVTQETERSEAVVLT